MFVCGTLREMESDRFSVSVGHEYRKEDERVARLLPVEDAPLLEWTIGKWVDLVWHRQGETWRWQGEFHPAGRRQAMDSRASLSYKETVAVSEPQAKGELKA